MSAADAIAALAQALDAAVLAWDEETQRAFETHDDDWAGWSLPSLDEAAAAVRQFHEHLTADKETEAAVLVLVVKDGIASLYDDDATAPPIAEGFGATNDLAVADLFSKVSF